MGGDGKNRFPLSPPRKGQPLRETTRGDNTRKYLNLSCVKREKNYSKRLKKLPKKGHLGKKLSPTHPGDPYGEGRTFKEQGFKWVSRPQPPPFKRFPHMGKKVPRNRVKIPIFGKKEEPRNGRSLLSLGKWNRVG